MEHKKETKKETKIEEYINEIFQNYRIEKGTALLSSFIKEKFLPLIAKKIFEGKEKEVGEIISSYPDIIGDHPNNQISKSFLELFVKYCKDKKETYFPLEKNKEKKKEEPIIVIPPKKENVALDAKELKQKIENSSPENDKISQASKKDFSYEEKEKINKEVLKTKPIETEIKETSFNKVIKNKKEIITGDEALKEIGQILENGVDRIVIHGNIQSTPEGIKYLNLTPDLDTLGALYLLNNVQSKNKKANISYKEKAYIQVVEKGESVKDIKPGEVVVHIDTGGHNLCVIKENEAINIFIDHHSREKGEFTSATALVAKILENQGKLEKKPEWLDRFISFVNEVENLTYLEKRDKNGRKIFTKEFFQNVWPRSLYSLYKKFPFKFIIKIFQEKRNLWSLFTPQELKGILGDLVIIKEKNKAVTLRDLVTAREGEVRRALFGIENIIKAKKTYFTPELGKIIYHNFIKISDLKEPHKKFTNFIPNELGFLATKAMGYDTYIVFNPQNKKYFVNSFKGLEGISKRLAKIVPKADEYLVRGTMLFSPVDENAYNNLTEEKFLQALGIQKK